MHKGIYAIIITNKGSIKIKLTHDKTPGTVGNFVGLVEGALKNNVNDVKFDMDTEESQILFEQLIINVILYVGIKNIVFKNIFHIISN